MRSRNTKQHKSWLSVLLIFFIIILNGASAFSQNDIVITEGISAEICGRTIIIDGFWIDNYEIKYFSIPAELQAW